MLSCAVTGKIERASTKPIKYFIRTNVSVNVEFVFQIRKLIFRIRNPLE